MRPSSVRRLVLVGAFLVLTGCGGGASSTDAGSPTLAPAVSATAPTPSPAVSASTTPAAAAGGSVDGQHLCDVMKRIRADLGASAPAEAYKAQYVISIGDLIAGQEKVDTYAAQADPAAKGACESTYTAFLRIAKMSSLSDL